jgi:hypothetical protein
MDERTAAQRPYLSLRTLRGGRDHVKVAGRWRYVYRVIDQFGQVIDMFVSPGRGRPRPPEVVAAPDARAVRRTVPPGWSLAAMPSSRTFGEDMTHWPLKRRRTSGWPSRSTSWPWQSELTAASRLQTALACRNATAPLGKGETVGFRHAAGSGNSDIACELLVLLAARSGGASAWSPFRSAAERARQPGSTWVNPPTCRS